MAVWTTGYVPVHRDGYADWSGLTITDDRPAILLSPGYKWVLCVINIDEYDRRSALTPADGEGR